MTEEDTDKKLDDSYMDEVYSDGRLDSGSDSSSVNSDLDFIKMSGLTAPTPSSPAEPVKADYDEDDLDPEAPVSFYEEGVDDVDSHMDPANASVLDDEILGRDSDPASETSKATAEPEPSSSLEGLQNIISELSKSDDPPATEQTAPDPVENVPVESILDSVDATAFEEAEIPIETMPDEPEVEAVEIEEIVPEYEAMDMEEGTSDDHEDATVSSMMASINFEEAESLIDELESQDKDRPIVPQPAQAELPEPELQVDLDSLSTTPPPVYNEPEDAASHDPEAVMIPTVDLSQVNQNLGAEPDASIYNKPHQLPNTPPRHKRRRSPAAGLGQLVVLLTLLVALGLAAVYGYEQVRSQTMTPDDAYNEGTRLLNDAQFEQASNHFLNVARKYAGHSVGPDAEFMAAYALFVVPESNGSKAMDAYTRSRTLMQSFLNNYPQHEKAARGETLMAMLHYRLGEYPSAIRILSNPDRRLRDPDGYLPAMRTLGRAYAHEMEYAKAEESLLRAASLDENLAPDEDYLELAGMFNDLASHETSSTLATEYLEKAIVHWRSAIKSPGTIASKRRDINVLIEYAQTRIDNMNAGETADTTQAVTPSATPDPESTDAAETPDASNTEIDFDSLRLPDTTP